MRISEREMLNFCDLTNLTLEFANPIKKVNIIKDKRTKKEIKVIEYYTIHSLLEAEYKGLEERVGQGLVKPIVSSEIAYGRQILFRS